MDNELVSIIVPIYKVEEYLEECIDSLIAQTYTNLEIILVDDGSPDRCPEICEKYALIDSRIKVIHKQNGGLSDARNCGINEAKGEYIAFVDSDDLVAPRYVEYMYKSCKEMHTKIAACTYNKFYSSEKICRNIGEYQLDCIMKGKELIKQIYYGNMPKISFTAWNKLYKKDLFSSDIRYPLGRIYEDTHVTYKLFLKSNNIAIIKNCLYYYRIRESSIMTQGFSYKKFQDALIANSSVVNEIINFGEIELLQLASAYYLKNTIVSYYKDIKKINKKERKKAKRCLSNNYCLTYRKCDVSNCAIFQRVVFFLFYVKCKCTKIQ